MATHDYVIANGTGAAVRSDLNGALAAIVSQNSSATEPSPSYAYQRWADTTAGVMKMRNGANNAWISLYELDGTFLGGEISLSAGAAATPSLFFTGDTNTGMWSPAADTLAWSTGGVERARVSSTGMWSVNTALAESSPYFDGKFRVVSSETGSSFSTTGSAAQLVQTQWHQATTGDNGFTVFGTESSFALRGSISYNRAGGVVAYNTTSDYRAKTILGDIEDPGSTIDALRIYRGLMNGATIERPMLIAHEAQEVAPYCVSGQKDAEDDNGNPIYQQMDHQVLIPLLIAEIQQLRIRVAALEGA